MKILFKITSILLIQAILVMNCAWAGEINLAPLLHIQDYKLKNAFFELFPEQILNTIAYESIKNVHGIKYIPFQPESLKFMSQKEPYYSDELHYKEVVNMLVNDLPRGEFWKNSRLLEIGPGGGLIATLRMRELANLLHLSVEPWGIELSNLCDEPAINLLEGNCFTILPHIQPESFQIVLISNFIGPITIDSTKKDLQELIEHIHRILKPEGFFVVSDLLEDLNELPEAQETLLQIARTSGFKVLREHRYPVDFQMHYKKGYGVVFKKSDNILTEEGKIIKPNNKVIEFRNNNAVKKPTNNKNGMNNGNNVEKFLSKEEILKKELLGGSTSYKRLSELITELIEGKVKNLWEVLIDRYGKTTIKEERLLLLGGLAKLKAEEALPFLIEQSREPFQKTEWPKIARTIGEIGGIQAREFIQANLIKAQKQETFKYLSSETEESFQEIIWACTRLSDKEFSRVERILVDLLQSQVRKTFREAAIDVLRQRGDPGYLIEEFQNAQSVETKRAIVTALGVEKNTEDIQLLELLKIEINDYDIAKEAALALINLKQTDFLIQQLYTDSTRCEAVANALIEHGYSNVGLVLQSRLENTQSLSEQERIAEIMITSLSPRARFYGYLYFAKYHDKKGNKRESLYYQKMALLLKETVINACNNRPRFNIPENIRQLIKEMKKVFPVTPMHLKINHNNQTISNYEIKKTKEIVENFIDLGYKKRGYWLNEDKTIVPDFIEIKKQNEIGFSKLVEQSI